MPLPAHVLSVWLQTWWRHSGRKGGMLLCFFRKTSKPDPSPSPPCPPPHNTDRHTRPHSPEALPEAPCPPCLGQTQQGPVSPEGKAGSPHFGPLSPSPPPALCPHKSAHTLTSAGNTATAPPAPRMTERAHAHTPIQACSSRGLGRDHLGQDRSCSPPPPAHPQAPLSVHLSAASRQ